MEIINGKEIAVKEKENLREKIQKKGLKPGLAIILVGNYPSSEIYVRNKLKMCEDIGIQGKLFRFNLQSSEREIIDCIHSLNQDKNIHGILVQLPLPNKFQENKILDEIDSKKDVDGFGRYNLGSLLGNDEKVMPATPKGILKMLDDKKIDLEGKHIVVVGRSKIVGRPIGVALLNRDATVTITHSKTKNLKEITRLADILIVAVGIPNFIHKEDVKENVIVIDVGINRVQDKIVGDVDYSVQEKASYFTPVPGGVGPMTIAMLLSNVVESAQRKEKNNG